MRILLLGATGLIGSAVAARLTAEGHDLIGVARNVDSAARRIPVSRWVALDLRDVKGPEDWRPHLEGIEAVVNCAGTLQAGLRDSPAAVHVDSALALWRACEQSNVRRVVHLSAIGVDRGGVSDFSRSKAVGDAALESSRLDWVILRPSVVVGRSAYGGSALFRAVWRLVETKSWLVPEDFPEARIFVGSRASRSVQSRVTVFASSSGSNVSRRVPRMVEYRMLRRFPSSTASAWSCLARR